MRAGRPAAASYDLVVGGVALALLGVFAVASNEPLLFPSLGPTLMLVLDSPWLPSARPVDAIMGHYVGIAAGLAALAVTGLWNVTATVNDVNSAGRVAAAALSLGATAATLRLLGRSHPPAGATTLIVSLGLMTSARQIAAIAGAVAVLVVLCMLIRKFRPKVLERGRPT